MRVSAIKDIRDCPLYTGQELEAEGNDRASLALSGHQLSLLQDVVAAGNVLEQVIIVPFQTLSYRLFYNKSYRDYTISPEYSCCMKYYSPGVNITFTYFS